MQSGRSTIVEKMSGSENHQEKNSVTLSDEKCHGIDKDIPCSQSACVKCSSLLAVRASTAKVLVPSISKKKKNGLKLQLLTMLGDSCLLLQKAKFLEKQSHLLLEETSENGDAGPPSLSRNSQTSSVTANSY